MVLRSHLALPALSDDLVVGAPSTRSATGLSQSPECTLSDPGRRVECLARVNPGYYLSTKSFAVEVIGNEGGTLPGPSTVKYVAVPFPLLFAVVPVVGLAFLMFLPAIGFYLLGKALVMRVTGHVADGATSLAATVAPDLATGAAYMTGHKDQEKAADKASPELEKLAKEVEEKRR